MDDQSLPAATQQAKSDNNKWYREHKDEPEVRKAFRESAKRYYYKNQEKEKLRCLKKYYAKTGRQVPERRLAAVAAQTPGTTAQP